MKKVIVLAFVALFFIACKDSNETEKTTVESNENNTITDTSETYLPADGDVIYTERKVRVRKNGKWVVADNDVTLDNGVVITRNGRVRKDGRERDLEDGYILNRTGDFFDRSGRAIENAWDATKEGAKDAGRAVKDAAEKVGDKTKDLLDRDSTRR